MVTNINCAEPGCTNPVIGKCVGYQGECGQFYCSTHSYGKLCSECGRRKRRDEIEAETYKAYLEAAQWVKSRGVFEFDLPSFAASVILLAIIILPLLLDSALIEGEMSHVYAYFALLGISLVAFIVSIIYLWAKRKSNEKQRIAELTKKKPGFDKFYKDWKKHEDYKHLMKTLRE